MNSLVSRSLPYFLLPCLLVCAAHTAKASTVLDLIGDLQVFRFHSGLNAMPSQFFTDFPSYSSTTLQTFSVNTDQLEVTKVSALFRAQGGFATFNHIEGYYLNVFSARLPDNPSLIGDIASLYVPYVTGGNVSVMRVFDPNDVEEIADYGHVTLNVKVPLPTAGEYRIGVSAVASSSAVGSFFLMPSTSGPSASTPVNSVFLNPGTNLATTSVSPLPNHYAYSIAAVPEPATTLLVILSSSLLLYQRRRLS